MLTGGDLETKWIVKQTNKNTKTNKTKQTKPKTKQINKNKQKKAQKNTHQKIRYHKRNSQTIKKYFNSILICDKNG